MEVSFILNTGIQYYQLEEEVTIDMNVNTMKALRFYEFQIQDRTYLDPVYYFPMKDKYLRRNDLICSGYLDPTTNEIVPEDVINTNMNWLHVDQLLSVNRLNITVGDRKRGGLEQIENHWLPLPFYETDIAGITKVPTNWCRMKLVPITHKCTTQKRVYRIVLAFDTLEDFSDLKEAPVFQGQPFKRYSLCGISHMDMAGFTEQQKKTLYTILLPLKAYEFCDVNSQPWLNTHLQEILHATDTSLFPVGSRMKYLAYYMYFLCYVHQLDILPDVRLYSDKGLPSIHTNLVLDVGNSRTFGLVAEDPLNMSFSKSSILEICDLGTGDRYAEPFDMRLCFKEERFGLTAGINQFKWPSIVRLGKEAARNIYSGSLDLLKSEPFDTSHSSPKRYLWDKKPYEGQWKYVSEVNRVVGPAQTVFLEGLTQQFHNDGTFAADPKEMGEKSSYSRCSLMTFCFIEILLQVRMQINGVKFRKHNGQEARKREISRVILTCPTAMSKAEQRTLRKCMEEATIVLKRYYGKTYNMPYHADQDQEKVEIIPSVRDLSLSVENLDMRRSWNYDEATCCQMVYIYSELRRYLGNSSEFFNLYGKKRNGETCSSLTIASIDIGAGTSDLMICNYKNSGESIVPHPLFWESFHISGDNLIKRIITDVILESPEDKYPGVSGIITAKLQSMRCSDISNQMHHFFSDTASMGVVEKRMRKEFCVQVLIPIANHLLGLLQSKAEDQTLLFKDIFQTETPAQSLMDFFADHFHFRFEELPIRFSSKFLNEIVRKVFEPTLRKWAAIFYTYRCDIVLLGGRPCSLEQIHNLIRRLYPVPPNRLISMNNYRVGSWYPGSTDIGRFSDKKSLVAVGALIAYLAESGKLPMFKLTTDYLKMKIQPSTEYIGIMNPHTGTLENFLTPEINNAYIEISAFPIYIGSKQLDVAGYPAQLLCVLDFNTEYLHQQAIENIKKQMNLPLDSAYVNISPDSIMNEMDIIKFRTKSNIPLRFRLEREYHEDKENIQIDTLENSEHDDLSKRLFRLALQSWTEDESNWLDSGRFILHIGL